MIVAFIKVRADGFWRFKEDGSIRRWWSPVSSVATSESLADIYFSSIVRESCLSLVNYGVDWDLHAEEKVVVLMKINLL